MNQKTIKLNDSTYHEYLEGKEIVCNASALDDKTVAEGERVLVYKDTVGTNTDVALPKREMQADYVGVEGVITAIDQTQPAVHVRKI